MTPFQKDKKREGGFTRCGGWDKDCTSVVRWGSASGVLGDDERIVRDIEVVFFCTLKQEKRQTKTNF